MSTDIIVSVDDDDMASEWQPMKRQPGPRETWANGLYVAEVERRGDGSASHLDIRRADRQPAHDWRAMQRIKNEIAGADVEAVELYPAACRVVDLANQYHLWCFPPGERLPVGWHVAAPLTDNKSACASMARGTPVADQRAHGPRSGRRDCRKAAIGEFARALDHPG